MPRGTSRPHHTLTGMRELILILQSEAEQVDWSPSEPADSEAIFGRRMRRKPAAFATYVADYCAPAAEEDIQDDEKAGLLKLHLCSRFSSGDFGHEKLGEAELGAG